MHCAAFVLDNNLISIFKIREAFSVEHVCFFVIFLRFTIEDKVYVVLLNRFFGFSWLYESG